MARAVEAALASTRALSRPAAMSWSRRSSRALDAGEPEKARELAAQAAAVAETFADPDLAAFARLGDGQALIALGDVRSATARFDEVMLSVSTGEVGPVVAGIVYCAVILECMQVFDLARASEWTEALHGWCEGQPELVPYRGQCLVHRSQLQQAAGDWASAHATVRRRRAIGWRIRRTRRSVWRGTRRRSSIGCAAAFDEAAAAYGQASASGHDPMPGLALLELARGDVEGAAAGIRRALDSDHDAAQRPALLAAAVDILREAGDIAGVRRAADELPSDRRRITDRRSCGRWPSKRCGAALLGEGEPAGALAHLRAAHTAWTGLQMPLRDRPDLGPARSGLPVARRPRVGGSGVRATPGRSSTPSAPRPTLDRLRALQPTVGRRSRRQRPTATPDLSAREIEVLAHVAAGRDQPGDRRGVDHQPAHGRTAPRRTSSPSSASTAGPRRPPTPTSTAFSDATLEHVDGASDPSATAPTKWGRWAMRDPRRDSYGHLVGDRHRHHDQEDC